MNRREFLLGTAAATFAAGGCRSFDGERSTRPIRIAHCGDPQFGFSRCGDFQAYLEDMARFERLIDRVNEERPDLCCIAGDMCDWNGNLERDWPRLMKKFRVPVVVTPGNHDMGNVLTRENVERFRRVFGYDYTSHRVGPWRLISGNSQYWRPTGEEDLRNAYESWLADEFASARAAAEPVIVLTHIPLFIRTMGEGDDYENHPKESREARLDAYVKAGVRYCLCGHTHRLYSRAERGIVILNAETTCRNFDERPTGYRMLTLRGEADYSWDFRRI